MLHLRIKTALISLIILTVSVGCSSSGGGSSLPEIKPVGETVRISPQSVVFEWQKPYEQKLVEFASGGAGSGAMFDLCDLDGNGTPELILSPGSGTSMQCEIYTFTGGKVSRMSGPCEETGSCGEVYFLPEKRLLCFKYKSSGIDMGTYCRMSGTDLKNALSYYSSSPTSGSRVKYELNGEEVHLSKYEETLAEYQPDREMTGKGTPELPKGRKYTITSDTVKYALYSSESWGAALTGSEKQLYRNKLASLLDTSSPDAAFELCDMNGDNVPELIYSEGTFDGAGCRVFTIEKYSMTELVQGLGVNGRLSWDVKNAAAFCTDITGEKFWKYDEGYVSGISVSDSTMSLGRKYILSGTSITEALR